MSKQVLITIALVIVCSSASFFAGMKYQESKSPFGSFRRGQNGANSGTGGMRQGFRPVNGEIIDNDTTGITVKLQDGSSKIVFVSDKTIINKAEKATLKDLKKGEKVAVFGTDNSDGSVTAQNIQLNPIGRMR